MKETGTVTLGGVNHEVKAFTLDQLQTVLPALVAYGREVTIYGVGGGDSIKHALAVLKAAVPNLDTTVTPSNIYEVFEAVNELQRVAGFEELGEKLGQAETEEKPTGSESTPT